MLARPERTRLLFADQPGATPIELPRRPAVLPALIVAGMFVVFAAVLVIEIRSLHFETRSLADLAGALFKLFWILGWSLGVAILGALTVLLWFYRDLLYVDSGRLIAGSRIGPLRMLGEYDVARIRNLRAEPQGGGDAVRVRFDYGEASRDLGNAMSLADAERVIAAIRRAMPGEAVSAGAPASAVPAAPARAAPLPAAQADAAEPLTPASTLALVGANLVPLAGVLFGGWKLADVMVLFWAESAVVAFYTLLKMAVVGRWLALPAGLFFIAHFGAFMAIHFLFLYEIFVRGIGARGHEPGAYEALAGVFLPLWPALVALFLSHGVSFAMNFLGRSEHRGLTVTGLMAAPYNRIVLMQFTLIFGGWIALALHNPTPALALLVALKIGVDLYAHRRERRGTPRSVP